MRVMLDMNERPLVPGTRVAYNRSGNVVFGSIVHVTKGGTFKIEAEDAHRRYGGGISTVKNAGSVLSVTDLD